MNTLDEWLEVQGCLINLFNPKYGFKRIERPSDKYIILVFDGVDYTAYTEDFTSMTIEELPNLVNMIEKDISRFW